MSSPYRPGRLQRRHRPLRSLACLLLLASGGVRADRPGNIGDAATVIQALQVDMRYAGDRNPVGRPLAGYLQPRCLLTAAAADALAQAQSELLAYGLGLKVYDCYRPRSAVDDLYAWAGDFSDLAMQGVFYAEMAKPWLVMAGFVADRSDHVHASAVDVTIVPRNSAVPAWPPGSLVRDCRNAPEQRTPDNSLDFGAGYGCFSSLSNVKSMQVSPQARANRLLLRVLMEQAGFKPRPNAWWHFSLVQDPYADRDFDFPVQD